MKSAKHHGARRCSDDVGRICIVAMSSKIDQHDKFSNAADFDVFMKYASAREACEIPMARSFAPLMAPRRWKYILVNSSRAVIQSLLICRRHATIFIYGRSSPRYGEKRDNKINIIMPIIRVTINKPYLLSSAYLSNIAIVFKYWLPEEAWLLSDWSASETSAVASRSHAACNAAFRLYLYHRRMNMK